MTLTSLSLFSAYFFLFQWNLKETPKSWGGLMVKAQFKCEDSSSSATTEHLVVIKYAGTFKGTNHPTKSSSMKHCE